MTYIPDRESRGVPQIVDQRLMSDSPTIHYTVPSDTESSIKVGGIQIGTPLGNDKKFTLWVVKGGGAEADQHIFKFESTAFKPRGWTNDNPIDIEAGDTVVFECETANELSVTIMATETDIG